MSALVPAGCRQLAVAALALLATVAGGEAQTIDSLREPILIGQGALEGAGGWLTFRGAGPAFDQRAWLQLPWPAYTNAGGAVHPAFGDVDGDGLDELVIGLASGSGGWFAVLDDRFHGHAVLGWLQLPWPAYNEANGAVHPAVGDLDGDGRAEIVAAPGRGSAGWFAIFDDASAGFGLLAWRQVQWPNYTHGSDGRTHAAVGDLDGDGASEIVIGLGPGSLGWIEIFGGAARDFRHERWLQISWPAYNAMNGAVYPAVGDLDADGRAEIVAGLGQGGGGWFQIIDDARAGHEHRGWKQVPWPAYNEASGETHPAVGNVDGDPAAEIVIGFGTFPAEGGWFALMDDLDAGVRHLGWRNVNWAPFKAAGGATWPAVSATADSLLALLRLDGSAEDTSGRGHHGTVSQAPSSPDRFGTPGGALSFNGTGSYVEVAGLPPLAGDFTISFWLKTPYAHRMHAISFGDRADEHLDISVNDGTGVLAYWNSTVSGVQYIGAGSTREVTDDGWHHVALVRQDDRVELLIDGAARGWTVSNGVFARDGRLRIGRGSYLPFWFQGSLDEVVVFGRALGVAEVAALSRDRPRVMILAPDAGRQWQTGTAQTIIWTADPGIAAVDIEYSLDNGATWQAIARNVNAAAGRYSWTIPASSNRIAQLRVADAADARQKSVARRVVLVAGASLWERVTASAAWGPRDGVGTFVFNSRMWLVGGYHPTDPSTPREIWSSGDGAAWRDDGAGPWSSTHACGCVVFNGRMWIIGGGGNPDVWSSTDGVTWTLALADGPWGRRYKPYVVVHAGRIWLMGGVDFFDGAYTPYNDVWSSPDGVTWTRVVAQAPWSPRGIIHDAAVFGGRIWLIGGGLYGSSSGVHPEIYLNDIWSSADGIEWTLVTARAPWAARIHHSAFVYADRLWVLAGHDAGGLRNDVWVSDDGVDWIPVPGAPWSPRHAASTLVFNDSLWMMAGYLVNDVWRLRLAGAIEINDGAASTTNPQVTLTLAPPDPAVDAMQFSNDGATWSQPEGYARTKAWTLSGGAGSRTVYVRFSRAGAWTRSYSDRILYN